MRSDLGGCRLSETRLTPLSAIPVRLNASPRCAILTIGPELPAIEQMITNRGLRHLALRVADLDRAREFYSRVFGMKLVWQPDPDNAYLTSGCDNLALHRSATSHTNPRTAIDALDHLGFVVATIAEVEAGYQWAQASHLDLAHPLKHHRDGSVSFYLRDPDGNLVQVLYEPAISPISLVSGRA
ncbi:MAG TPA: VOC family protein [Candidatus Binataceae bacterium]|nr:VOC family protein [Candidatus Binataceae bacterium]